MRQLIQCPECSSQFDASAMATGDKLRCLCGETLIVAAVEPRDAAVVRCSSCGASRSSGSASCAFCGSDFTLHERDLHTICPSCMARIGDRARYCHHCSTPIRPQAPGGRAVGRSCPLCGPEHPLQVRRLGTPPVCLLECSRCAGLWLQAGTFQDLLSRARSEVPQWALEPPRPARAAAPDGKAAAPGSFYRPCPECGKLMNRRNFGRKSGVVIDTCREHGAWFDASELDEILRWVRGGGEARAEEMRREAQAEASRAARLAEQRADSDFDPGSVVGPRGDLLAVLGRLIGWLGLV